MNTKTMITRAVILLAVAVALFLIISGAGSGKEAAVSHGAVTEETEWIIIGDSYAVNPKAYPKKTWPERLRRYLKLTADQAHLIKKSGYGIARTGKRYYDVLKKLDDSENVKFVVMQSGPANDRDMSKKQIRRETKRLAKLIKEKYPNAKVFYCCPNWNDRSKRMRKFLKARKKWYRSYAIKYGWHYMGSVQNIYVGDHKWCVKDGHHPNARGARMLAKGMYAILTKYVS